MESNKKFIKSLLLDFFIKGEYLTVTELMYIFINNEQIKKVDIFGKIDDVEFIFNIKDNDIIFHIISVDQTLDFNEYYDIFFNAEKNSAIEKYIFEKKL